MTALRARWLLFLDALLGPKCSGCGLRVFKGNEDWHDQWSADCEDARADEGRAA